MVTIQYVQYKALYSNTGDKLPPTHNTGPRDTEAKPTLAQEHDMVY